MSHIQIIPVQTRKQYKVFASFPFQLYKSNPYWVPWNISSEVKTLMPQTNPAYEDCDAAFWLAVNSQQEVVGRIGAIINHKYNEKVNEAIGRFSRFECIDDREVSGLLLQTAEEWLRQRGMKKILGPLGFNNLDAQGLLVEGFNHLAAVGSVYHLPYYKDHLEYHGYEKEIDWLEFQLKVGEIPEKVLRINELIKQKYKLRVRSFRNKKEMLSYGRKVFNLFNTAFEELPFVSPLSERLIEFYQKKYLKQLIPQYVKVVVNEDDEVVAFIISIPSFSKALQKSKGKLFPFGIYYFYRAIKHPEGFELLLTGIHPKYQGMGVAALLMTEIHKEIIKTPARWVETTGMFETNMKAIDNWKNYEYIQHKRKRCYRKIL